MGSLQLSAWKGGTVAVTIHVFLYLHFCDKKKLKVTETREESDSSYLQRTSYRHPQRACL